jgi:3-oxoadipate enol-lactonase
MAEPTQPILIDVVGERIAWRHARPATPDGGVDPAGAVDTEVVLLLHGLGGSRISWEPQLAGLGKLGPVAAWDLPGYGASPPLDRPMTFAALADAVVGWMDELGVARAHLVGISFGGMIAQYTAAAHPDRVATLTLLSTSPKFGLDGTVPDEWRAARLAPLDAGQEPIDFADAVLGALAGPSITADALAGQRAAMARITAAALRRSIDCLIEHDSRALLSQVRAPTTCLVGSLDTETPPAYSQAIVDLVPGASLEVVPGAGHLLNVEAPDAVNAAIVRQIERSRS